MSSLTHTPISQISSRYLEALHKAHEAYTAVENSERIRRGKGKGKVLCEVKYMTGDQVFFKCAKSRKWDGPATVLGEDGQQVLFKSGGTYIQVHPCRLKTK